MKKGKTALIIGAIVLQCIVLVAMSLQREVVLATGKTVYIRTTPVDPRDLFRGDYVRLQYEISSIPISMVLESERDEARERDCRVYLSFTTDSTGLLQPLRLSPKKPEQGFFLRGLTNKSSGMISARYGIEKYFMQQGKAQTLQNGRWIEGIRIPLEMEVAVGSSSGIAVLKGYRYADMGMSIEILRRGQGEQNVPFMVRVRIINTTEKSLAIIDPPRHDTFSIELSNRFEISGETLRLLNPIQPPGHYQTQGIKVIAPKGVYTFELDLSDPRFQLVRGDKLVGFNDMKWNEQARIIYTATPPGKMARFPNADLIWQGSLKSNAFSGYHFVN